MVVVKPVAMLLLVVVTQLLKLVFVDNKALATLDLAMSPMESVSTNH